MKSDEIKQEQISDLTLDLSRQAILIPFNKINEWTIKVFGVGSVGSHLVKLLAKTGFKQIEVYDMDVVGTENISAQAYDFRHIGKPKVTAMAEIVKESAGIDVVTHNEEITEKTEIMPEPKTIYCCVFDSFETRKMLFDKLKDMPIIFVDGRIGGFNLRHYLVNCANPEEVKNYETTLTTGAVSELTCGEKASSPINYQIVGKMVINIVNFIAGNPYLKRFLGNVMYPKNDILIFNENKI